MCCVISKLLLTFCIGFLVLPRDKNSDATSECFVYTEWMAEVRIVISPLNFLQNCIALLLVFKGAYTWWVALLLLC